MGHRHHAAELGRFISRDPIGFRGGLNLFNGHGTSPLTFVDPSGLDLTVVFTTKPSGQWIDRGWGAKTFTPETLYQVEDFLRAHENRIIGIVTDGHGGPTLCGADWNEDRYVGIKYKAKTNEVGIQFELRNPKTQKFEMFFDPISDLKFPNLKFVTSRSCDTAGGHPEHASKKGSEFLKSINGYDPYEHPPYDPNSNADEPIARILSTLWPTAIVTGNMGPQWQHHNGVSTPQRYQNGQPLP
jgi:hypothetical protein